MAVDFELFSFSAYLYLPFTFNAIYFYGFHRLATFEVAFATLTDPLTPAMR